MREPSGRTGDAESGRGNDSPAVVTKLLCELFTPQAIDTPVRLPACLSAEARSAKVGSPLRLLSLP